MTKQNNKWEEEFDELIEPAIDKGFDEGCLIPRHLESQKAYRNRIAWREDIKSFIAKLLKAKQIELLEELEMEERHYGEHPEWEDGFNTAVKELNQKLSNLKSKL